jgi:hypothetical protein
MYLFQVNDRLEALGIVVAHVIVDKVYYHTPGKNWEICVRKLTKDFPFHYCIEIRDFEEVSLNGKAIPYSPSYGLEKIKQLIRKEVDP